MSRKSPNIVFIMPDQLRWDFVGAYGKAHAKPPNIDKLAVDGMVYERCVSPSPACLPARASMLTGHNSIATGVLNNFSWLRPDHDACGVPGFPTLLSGAGYHTEAIGKMRFIPWDSPERFAHRVVAEDKRHIHIRDDYHDYLNSVGLRKMPPADEPGYRSGGGASIGVVPLEHQVDTWVGNEAVRFLQRYADERPYFLWVGFPGPHDPYNPPREILDDITEDMPAAFADTDVSKPFQADLVQQRLHGNSGVDITDFTRETKRQMRRHYQGLVRIIDRQVGAILNALNQRDDGRETLLVFASDHGDFLGDFSLLGKFFFFESAIHVPLIVSGAGVPRGRSNALVSLTDLFATFTEAAGVKSPRQDSLPLPGIGLGEEQRTHVMGATDKGYMICDARWKLSRYRGGICTLRDVVADPGEQINRWDDPAACDVREALDRRLQDWLIESILASHADKKFANVTMVPDDPAHGRGWRRPYPSSFSAA